MLINIVKNFFYKPLYVLNNIKLIDFIDISTSYCKKYSIDLQNKYQLNYNCSDDNTCEFNNFNENLTISLIIDIIKKNSSFFVCKNLGGILIDNIYYKNNNITIDKKYIFIMIIDIEIFMKYINDFNYENVKIIDKYFEKYNIFVNTYKRITNIYESIYNIFNNIINNIFNFFLFRK